MDKPRKHTVSPRISIKTKEFYESRFDSLNSGVTYAIESFPALFRSSLHETKGKFKSNELMFILDVMSSTTLKPELIGQHLSYNLADAIHFDQHHTKWGVDADTFYPKVVALTRAQAAAIELWAYFYKMLDNQDLLEHWCRTLL